AWGISSRPFKKIRATLSPGQEWPAPMTGSQVGESFRAGKAASRARAAAEKALARDSTLVDAVIATSRRQDGLRVRLAGSRTVMQEGSPDESQLCAGTPPIRRLLGHGRQESGRSGRGATGSPVRPARFRDCRKSGLAAVPRA